MAIGFYGDVVWTPQGFRVVCSSHPEQDLLLVYDERAELLAAQRFDFVGALLYVRAAASPDGSIAWVAQSLYDRLVIGRVSSTGEISARHTDYACAGQSGCAVSWKEGRFVVATLISPREYQIIWPDAVSEPLPVPIAGGTSQGWLDVDDTLHWIDQERDDTSLQLRFPSRAGDVSIGQDISSQADRLVGVTASGARFLVSNTLGMEPRLACDPDKTKWVACWRQPRSQFGIASFPPFPHVPAADEPPPDDPSDPSPDPEVPVVPNRLDIVRAIDAQFPHLLQANTYATCREFVWRCVEALAAVDPNFGFLTKSAGENHVDTKGHLTSVDAIAYRPWVGTIDIINGSTSGQPTTPSWGLHDGMRDTNKWLAAFPFDEDGDTPGPGPVGPGPSTDAIVAAVKAAVTAVLDEHESDVAEELSLLRKDITQLIREMASLPAGPALQAINTRLAAIEAKKAPKYRGSIRVFGMSGSTELTPVD